MPKVPSPNLQNILNGPNLPVGNNGRFYDAGVAPMCSACGSKPNPNLDLPEDNPCINKPAPDQSSDFPDAVNQQPFHVNKTVLDNMPLNTFPSEASDLLKSFQGGNPIGLPSRRQPWMLQHLENAPQKHYNPVFPRNNNNRIPILPAPQHMTKVPTSPNPCKDKANALNAGYITPLATIGTARQVAMGYASSGIPIQPNLRKSVSFLTRTPVQTPTNLIHVIRPTVKVAQHAGYGAYTGNAIN